MRRLIMSLIGAALALAAGLADANAQSGTVFETWIPTRPSATLPLTSTDYLLVVHGGGAGTARRIAGSTLITDSQLAANVRTFFGAPSSANLRAMMTDETGTGLLYFQGGDAGTPSALNLANATNLSLTGGVAGVLGAGNGGTNNAFTQFTGPTTATKTFTLPNASATILTTAAAVTLPQGGLGITSGTSGGIPYFASGTTVASSAALAAGLPVVGGGAGAAPTSGARSGNTTTFVTTTGTQTAGRCVTIDANGNHVPDAAPCGTGTGGSIAATDGTTNVNPTTTISFDPVTFDVVDSGSGTATVRTTTTVNPQAGTAYTAIASDLNKTIRSTGSAAFTLNLTAAATLGGGFTTYLECDGVGGCLIDPAGSETVDGAATLAVSQGEKTYLQTDGTGWRAAVLAPRDPLAAANLTGLIDPARGGTGLGSYAVGDLIYASGTTVLARLAGVATGNALLSGGVGVAPAWGKVGLTTHVSGVLPPGNGGTNNAFTQFAGPATAVKTFTLPNASATILTDAALVTVPQGGTGLAGGTSGGIPYFASGVTLASSATLTAGNPVVGGGAGAAPSSGARSGNTTTFVTTTGTQTAGRCVTIDANGNHVPDAAPCGTGGGSIAATDGTTTVSPTSTLSFDPTTFDVVDAGGGTATVRSITTVNPQSGTSYTAVASDLNKIIRSTGSAAFTLNLTAAATLGSGFSAYLECDGAGGCVVDPAGAETIDGAATLALPQYGKAIVQTDGTVWRGAVLSARDPRAVANLTGLGANVLAVLQTPSSANLRAMMTDETGTGALYFQGGDAGTPSAIVLTNATGLPAAAVTGVLGASVGGTGSGFTAFTGPTTATRTFTLPNANATILTDAAAVTAAQGGTGLATYAVGDLIYASGATTLARLADVATGSVVVSGGVGVAPAWGKVGLATHVSGNLPVTNLNGGTNASVQTFWNGSGVWKAPPTGKTYGWTPGVNPDGDIMWIADQPMTITSIKGYVKATVGSATTIAFYKATPPTVCDGTTGTALASTSINANTGAGTVQTLTLVGGATMDLATDDVVCAVATGGSNWTASATGRGAASFGVRAK